MKDWQALFDNMSEEDKDGVALLRVMECTNGVIQFAYRGNEPYALPIEQTRDPIYPMQQWRASDSTPKASLRCVYLEEHEQI